LVPLIIVLLIILKMFLLSRIPAIIMDQSCPGTHPNLRHQDSDHESDIECLD